MIPPAPMAIRQIMAELESGLIRIPDFQREFVWTANQVEILLDSIYKSYPLGSFLMWHTRENLQEKNPLNFPVRPPQAEKKYLLDGQQRAVVIYSVFKNQLKLRSGPRRTIDYRAYFDLATESFNLYRKVDLENGRIQVANTQIPVDEAVVIDTQAGSIDKSAYLRSIERRLIRDNDEIQLGHLDKLFLAFRDPVITEIVVEGTGLNAACEIFVRLNQEGTDLTVVDIMVAKTYSSNPAFNLRTKVDELNSELEPDFALKDLTILECIGACLRRGISEGHILDSSQEIRESWDDTTESLRKAIDYLRARRIVPLSKLLPFDVLLAPLTYYFYNFDRPTPNQLNQLEKFFWRASATQRYIEGQNTKVTADIDNMDVIGEGGEAPHYNLVLTAASIKEQELRLTSSICKTVLCLYSTLTPRDLHTNDPVSIGQCLSASNASQMHHVFPKKYLETLSGAQGYNERIKPFANSVANVCLVSALSNQIVGAKPPSEYLTELANANLRETLRTHLINGETYESLMENNFEAFLRLRSQEVYQALRQKYT